jgi:hypothetical protein
MTPALLETLRAFARGPALDAESGLHLSQADVREIVRALDVIGNAEPVDKLVATLRADVKEMREALVMFRDDYDHDPCTRHHRQGYGGICRSCYAKAVLDDCTSEEVAP